MDSFDHYVTADITEKWTQLPSVSFGDGTIAAVGRRLNGLRLQVTGGGGTSSFSKAPSKVLTTSGNTAIIGLGFRSVTAFAGISTGTDPDGTFPGPACLCVFKNAGVSQSWVRVNTNGTLSVFKAGSATPLGTTSVALAQNVYAFIEVLITFHDTAGVVTVRIDGATVLSLTSQNTRATLNAWNEFRLGPISVLPSDWNFDDLYVLDGSGSAPWNTFLGDCRVDARVPTAPGATTGFTPSTGANWQNVDDAAPNDDTDYNSAASVLTDTFTVQDAPVAGATIYGVQHCIAAKKTDAGVGTIAPVVRHSGVDNVGTSISPGTTYAYGLVVQSVNPGTSAAWTEAGFNAAEFGYKRLT
jgi:hypothetical protein